jgi:hypothetical protein
VFKKVQRIDLPCLMLSPCLAMKVQFYLIPRNLLSSTWEVWWTHTQLIAEKKYVLWMVQRFQLWKAGNIWKSSHKRSYSPSKLSKSIQPLCLWSITLFSCVLNLWTFSHVSWNVVCTVTGKDRTRGPEGMVSLVLKWIILLIFTLIYHSHFILVDVVMTLFFIIIYYYFIKTFVWTLIS